MAVIINFPAAGDGATPEEWAHFDLALGLTTDLLPVVSNAKAVISPNSSMSELGKTPSIYNGAHQVVGLRDWTSKLATGDEVATWSKDRDLGICIQTRTIRALDVDVPDPDQAAAIRAFIDERLQLPLRTRDNSPKFLLAFECHGELYKRRVKTAHGMIELLATGQQFIACGRHPSGARYDWFGGLPDAFPVLSLEQVNAFWAAIVAQFGIEAPSESSPVTRQLVLAEAIAGDPVAKFLLDKKMVKAQDRDGRMHITCPWAADHTTESQTSTTYFPAHTGGHAHGSFVCLHAHCADKTTAQFKAEIGYTEASALDGFEVLPDGPAPAPDAAKGRFAVIPAHEFVIAAPTHWLIKNVLPAAELLVLFGESGSGKTFMALDLAMSIARGVEWRGQRVRQGRVVYIAAEGAGGVRRRLQAYAQHFGLDLADLPLGIIGNAPNLLQKPDALEVAREIGANAALVIVDTFAQTMPGGNENSGEDVGLALAHCKGIHRATGAAVMMVHHAGKDSSKGARGWSGLRAAADAELEVVRFENDRALTVTKQKDGEDGGTFPFTLNTVLLGEDTDGDPLTSCVVAHSDVPAKRTKAGAGMGSIERMVVRILTDMNALVDTPATMFEVVEKAKNELIVEEGKRDQRRSRVLRALESLKLACVVVVNPNNSTIFLT